MVVPDQGDGFVPQPGLGLDEAPAQVDVLTGPHRLVEPAQLVERGPPADDGGAGHIGHRAVGNDGSLAQTQVER